MLDDFIAVSSALTGARELDRGVAAQYLERILNDKEGGKLGDMLRVFGEIQARAATTTRPSAGGS